MEYIKLIMRNSVDHYCLEVQDKKLDVMEEVSHQHPGRALAASQYCTEH